MPAQITITLQDDGSVGVNAPMQNKVLCYGLLEIARQIVASHKEENRITPVAGTLPPFPGRRD